MLFGGLYLILNNTIFSEQKINSAEDIHLWFLLPKDSIYFNWKPTYKESITLVSDIVDSQDSTFS